MKCPVYLFATLLILSGFAGAGDIDRKEAEVRLQAAISKTNIFELPSFSLQADIQVEVQGKLVNGSYELLWNGPEQWREGIQLPGYGEIQIGGKGKIWRCRGTDFLPLPIFELHQALGFGSTLEVTPPISLVQPVLGPRDTLMKQHERKDHGDKLSCVEIDHGHNLSSEACVSEARGTLVRPSQFSDEDFQPVGTRVFPKTLVMRTENHVTAKVTVTKLASPVELPVDAFTPIAEVTPQAGCMNPLAPRATDKPAPHYPESARQQHREATVSFEVLIGKDGIPKLQHLLHGGGTDFDDSAKEAILRWRYDPAQCSGQPVESETVLQVNYSLRP